MVKALTYMSLVICTYHLSVASNEYSEDLIPNVMPCPHSIEAQNDIPTVTIFEQYPPIIYEDHISKVKPSVSTEEKTSLSS